METKLDNGRITTYMSGDQQLVIVTHVFSRDNSLSKSTLSFLIKVGIKGLIFWGRRPFQLLKHDWFIGTSFLFFEIYSALSFSTCMLKLNNIVSVKDYK